MYIDHFHYKILSLTVAFIFQLFYAFPSEMQQ